MKKKDTYEKMHRLHGAFPQKGLVQDRKDQGK
jgi:hypothetical protein